MALYGNLSTMSVADLLAWVDAGRKSGTLEIERDKIVKRITFDAGRVTSCSSNNPATLMGQFLLASGKISQDTLSQALGRQSSPPTNLGQTLLEMGAITQADRDAFVQAKIEETIYGLFDWEDAVFRFYTDALVDPNAVEASLGIEEIQCRGRERSADRRRSDQVINDRRIVLRRTGKLPPPELAASRSAQRVFDLIDGTRSVAGIVLHSHASEFLVTKFLTALLHEQVVEIVGIDREAVPRIEPQETASEPEPAASAPQSKRGYRLLPSQPSDVSRELEADINVALQLMSAGRPEAALELLNAIAAVHPMDIALRQLVLNAEQAFCKKMLEGDLAASSIPTRSGQSTGQDPSAEESFLLEHVDGRTTVQSLLWVAPMRDVDVLKSLGRMLKKGWVELRRAA
jgi:Domain of unknown function (DUF4388)